MISFAAGLRLPTVRTSGSGCAEDSLVRRAPSVSDLAAREYRTRVAARGRGAERPDRRAERAAGVARAGRGPSPGLREVGPNAPGRRTPGPGHGANAQDRRAGSMRRATSPRRP